MITTDPILRDEEIQLVQEFCRTNEHWKPSTVAGGQLVQDARHCWGIGITATANQSNASEVIKNIDTMLHKAMGLGVTEYVKRFPECHIEGDTGYNFLRYDPEQFYEWHIDQGPHTSRSLSLILSMNDEFEGGEIEFFPETPLSISIPVGHALMFPSGFSFPHQVRKVTKGVRYSCVTWFN